MKKLTILLPVILAAMIVSGCVGPTYHDRVAEECRAHPPIYAPKDAEANEPAELIIIEDPEDKPLRTVPPATAPDRGRWTLDQAIKRRPRRSRALQRLRHRHLPGGQFREKQANPRTTRRPGQISLLLAKKVRHTQKERPGTPRR